LRLPKAERLLLDADINPRLAQYLTATGFDVVFAPDTDVDIHDDTAILRWARRRSRIMVCHDKFKDGKTRFKIFEEVYENGGRVIQVGSKPDRLPLTSLGLILANRSDRLKFFEEESSGMVFVHKTGMTRMNRAYCQLQYRKVLVDPAFDPIPALSRRRRSAQRTQRPRQIPEEQAKLILPQ